MSDRYCEKPTLLHHRGEQWVCLRWYLDLPVMSGEASRILFEKRDFIFQWAETRGFRVLEIHETNSQPNAPLGMSQFIQWTAKLERLKPTLGWDANGSPTDEFPPIATVEVP